MEAHILKLPEEELEAVELNVYKPSDCPFRRKERCVLCIKDDIIKSCSNKFVHPQDCPLRNCDLIIKIPEKVYATISDNSKNNNEETSPKTGQTT